MMKYTAPSAEFVHLQTERVLATSFWPTLTDVNYVDYEEFPEVLNTGGDVLIY